jgi:flagellar FliL protein
MTATADNDPGDLMPDGLPRKKFSGKKLVLFIILPLVLLIGVGGGVYSSGILTSLLGAGDEQAEAAAGEQASDPMANPIFYDLPDMLVNLNSAGKRPSFLKIRISIQLSKAEEVQAIERVLPRIVDNFQVYLRELRLEDLKGSAGMYRLRQELLLRITAAAHPVKVRDVLFREMLVQ